MTSSPLRALAAAVLCLAASPAFAQEAKPEAKPFRLQTAFDAPDWLKISGSFRPRYETLANTFTAGRTGGDDFLSWQALIKAEASFGHDIVLGAEMLDARRLAGDEDGSGPGEVDAIEPAQIYIAWRPKDFLMEGANLDLMLGRFTMDIGGRRLVSRTGFRNPLAEFDGVRAVWTHKSGVKATVFYTAPVNRTPSDAASAWDNEVAFNEITDTDFYGWNFETPALFGTAAEVYLYDLQENDAAGQPTRNRDLSTGGVRVKKPAKADTWDMDLEYAMQTGTVHNTTSPADTIEREHDASMLHAELGYTIGGGWNPRVSLHYDLASGDDLPNDFSSERFDPLFGDRAFELGPTGIWGALLRSNIDSPGLRVEAKPDKRNEIMAMVRNVRLDSATDSFGNSGVRDPTGASGKDVGVHYELRWRHQIVPDSLRLTVGAAAMTKGDFLKNAPNATDLDDPYYGYTQLDFVF